MSSLPADTLKTYILWEIRIAKARGDSDLARRLEERFKFHVVGCLDSNVGSCEGGAIAAICSSLRASDYGRAGEMVTVLAPILGVESAEAVRRIAVEMAGIWERSVSVPEEDSAGVGAVALSFSEAVGHAISRSEWNTLNRVRALLGQGQVGEATQLFERNPVAEEKRLAIGYHFDRLRRLGLVNYARQMTMTLRTMIGDGDLAEADAVQIKESALMREAGIDFAALRQEALRDWAQREVGVIQRQLASGDYAGAEAYFGSMEWQLREASVDFRVLRQRAVSNDVAHAVTRARGLLKEGAVEEADSVYDQKKELFREAGVDYAAIRQHLLLELAARLSDRMRQYLATERWDDAETTWRECERIRALAPFLPAIDFHQAQCDAVSVIASRLAGWLEATLASGEVEAADARYQAYATARTTDPRWPAIDYEELKCRVLRRVAVEDPRLDAQIKTREHLRAFEFMAADALQEELGAFAPADYPRVKTEFLARYFAGVYAVSLSDEQASTLACIGNDSLLIQARAGSGKTRTLTCVAALLLGKRGVAPHQVHLLAFNKKAVEELRERLKSVFGIDAPRCVSTFHAMAHQIVRPKEIILYDGDGDPKLSRFIAKTVDQAMVDSGFRQKLYTCFRTEMVQWEQIGAGLDPPTRLELIRSLNWISLAGEPVKSFGEKVIADFLFEHDVKYWYERPVWWEDRFYRPDFTIRSGDQTLILEHWAVDPDSREVSLPAGWSCTAAEYQCDAQLKRAFWNSPQQKEKTKGAVLIETDTSQLRDGRDAFERHLRSMLRSHGVVLNRLPEAVIADRVCERHANRISRLFAQFVLRMRKAGWSVADLQERMKTGVADGGKVALFLKMAAEVFERYEQRCREEGLIDFDTLLGLATDRIEATAGACPMAKDQKRQVSDLLWLLIDEFQDFSPQFDRMVQAIRRAQPGVRVVAVGDDWQAINAFAGSDLTYFQEFERRFAGSGRQTLSSNHRSAKSIVDAGNRVMAERGVAAKAVSCEAGSVSVQDVWQTQIKTNGRSGAGDAKDDDEKYRFPKQKGKPYDERDILARYVKLIHESLGLSRLFGRTVALLSRTNDIHGAKIGDLLGKLASVTTKEERKHIGCFSEKFHAGTIHSFKGKEADVVFLLEVCRGKYPLVHSDEEYFRVFGRSMDAILDEERRLFYVAVTRAKTHLFVLTEHDRPSDYIFEVFPEKAKARNLTRDGVRPGSGMPPVGS